MNASLPIGLAITGFAYMIGTVPFGVLVSRWVGASDPRTQGSGNIGCTNVLRIAGKGPAAATFLLDAGKGLIAVLVTSIPIFDQAPQWPQVAGIAVILGHTFPIWTRFRGGKGVATGIGALVALDPWIGLTIVIMWATVLIAFRYVSLASVSAAGALPLVVLMMGEKPLFAFAVVACVVIVVRHHENIGRLIHGTEAKLGRRAA